MSSRYNFTHIYRVRAIQRTAASEIRAKRYDPERLNEEAVYTRWDALLCSHGLSQDDAVRQITSLMDFVASALGTQTSSPCPATPLEEEVMDDVDLPSSSAEPAPQDAADVLQLGAYVISKQPKSNFRR